VAVARPKCLYCGAVLSATAVAAAAVASEAAARGALGSAAPPEVPAPERVLLILDLDAAAEGDAMLLARSLGVSAYEAGQALRRGGLRLHKILPRGAALRAGARLQAEGWRVYQVPEAEARAAPVLALGGRLDDGALDLRLANGRLRVESAGLRLVVRGPIAREYQTRFAKQGAGVASLEAGYRFHLHRADGLPTIEVDPWAFQFGSGTEVGRASLLTLSAWIESLAQGVPIDDAFRRLPPALAPEVESDLSAVSAAALVRRRPERKAAAQVLDNLRQFRFYSAWRGAAERKRGG
jgi:hypothetical protein